MQLLNIFHVLLAIAMIALILVQRGAGATAGAAFGSGASGTVFGASGAGNFLTRATSVAAIGFFAISLGMAVMASNMSKAVPEDEGLGVVANDTVVTEPVVTEQATELPVIPPVTENAQQSVDTVANDTNTETATDIPVVEAIEDQGAQDKTAEGENPGTQR